MEIENTLVHYNLLYSCCIACVKETEHIRNDAIFFTCFLPLTGVKIIMGHATLL